MDQRAWRNLLPLAPAAPQGAVARTARPGPAAPLLPCGFAAVGRRVGDLKKAGQGPSPGTPHLFRSTTMPDDAELDLLRRGVGCAAVLEQLAGWRLDAR